MTEYLRTGLSVVDRIFPGFQKGRVTYVAGLRQSSKTHVLLSTVEQLLQKEPANTIKLLFSHSRHISHPLQRGIPGTCLGTANWSTGILWGRGPVPDWDRFKGRRLSLLAFDEPPSNITPEPFEELASRTGAAVVLAGGNLTDWPLATWHEVVAFDMKAAISLGFYTRAAPGVPLPVLRTRYERCLGLDHV
jgi:hypothetical protein